jgi:hypothetical protein
VYFKNDVPLKYITSLDFWHVCSENFQNIPVGFIMSVYKSTAERMFMQFGFGEFYQNMSTL